MLFIYIYKQKRQLTISFVSGIRKESLAVLDFLDWMKTEI